MATITGSIRIDIFDKMDLRPTKYQIMNSSSGLFRHRLQIWILWAATETWRQNWIQYTVNTYTLSPEIEQFGLGAPKMKIKTFSKNWHSC